MHDGATVFLRNELCDWNIGRKEWDITYSLVKIIWMKMKTTKVRASNF